MENNIQETIIELAEELITIQMLTKKLDDKTFWVKKAQKEINFIPSEKDWIKVEVLNHSIIVNVYGLNSNACWINGHWTDNRFANNSTSLGKMLAEMRAW